MHKDRKKQNTDQVIKKFRTKHGDYYDYSKVDFVDSHSKVTIVCPKHGAFQQTPAIHLRGSGCTSCNNTKRGEGRRKSPEAMIEAFKSVHGLRYDYTPTIYTTSRSKVTVNCRIHGAFDVLPTNHLRGRGCSLCNSASAYQTGEIDPIAMLRATHGKFYDYSKVVYTRSTDLITIICPVHGSFSQQYNVHKNGHGCPDCGNARTAESRRFTTQELLDKFSEVHGDLYSYEAMNFVHTEIPILITCKTHGTFSQLPKNHLRGSGCPMCFHMTSRGETEIGDFLEQLGVEVIRNTRTLIPPKEIDLYLPDHQLAIEYCGLYWHTEARGKDSRYHYDKLEALNQLGIDLITIFEDEWLDRPDVVRSILTNRLGKSQAGVGGRQLQIEEITSGESRAFLNKHHIQGAATGSYHIGAFHKGVLVGVMVMGPPTRQMSLYQWELKRFAADGRNHPGMMGRLFNHFLRTRHPESIVSFSDNRWFPGGSYQQLGFLRDAEIAPDHYYVKNGVRYHKSKFRKSGIRRLHPEHYDEALTERAMMENIGYGRIWDCGKIRWVWTQLIEDQGSS